MLLTSSGAVRIDRELVAKGGLIDFVEMAWPEVCPSPFVRNWHHDEVCEHLEAMSRCDIRDLIINQPPGTTKSLIVNVLWPAWEWLKRPDTKYIFASFDATLVGRRDGGKVINLLASKWFVERWGGLLTETNPSASDFDIKGGGFRFATSPGGKGTGRHGNIVVVDDPTKPKDAAGGGTITKVALATVSDWWANTMPTRQANPKTHRQLIIMQRVHNSDLAGEMLRTGAYVHLCFPMRFKSDLKCRTLWGGDRREAEGSLLFPDRFPEAEVRALEIKMGPMVSAAQLQQRPDVEGGGIFKRTDWRFWATKEGVPEPCLCEKCFGRALLEPSFSNPTCPNASGRLCEVLPDRGVNCQSWDMTFKRTDDSDFVAADLWRQYGHQYFLRDFLNERLSFTQTKAMFTRWSIIYPEALDKLVEDAANGPAIESELKLDVQGITLVRALGGKGARANAVSPLYAAGKVFFPLPSVCPKVWQRMAQHEAFPRDTHDDMVDAGSQALLRMRQHGEVFSTAMARIRGK